jgi:hypothetical protein
VAPPVVPPDDDADDDPVEDSVDDPVPSPNPLLVAPGLPASTVSTDPLEPLAGGPLVSEPSPSVVSDAGTGAAHPSRTTRAAEPIGTDRFLCTRRAT